MKQLESYNEDQLKDCEFLKNLKAVSLQGGGLGRESGIESCRNQVLNQAAEIGATHIVWQEIGGFMSTEANAKAYRCESTGPGENIKE